jgi:uncharacterized protein
MVRKIILFFAISLLTSLLSSCSTTHEFIQQHFPVTTSPANVQSNAGLLEDASIWQANTSVTWSKLQHVPLKTLQTTKSNDPTINGWIQLAALSKRYSINTHELVPQLIAWRKDFPNHAGNQLFPDNATLENLLNQPHPKKIILLLPLQGQYASSGKSVREGFLSGYYHSLSLSQPVSTISFSDTAQTDITSLYQQAVNQGNDRVIGPLLKPHVQLMTHQNITVPTIALNYTDGSLPTNLYEFGLSPFDEAQQVAEKARQDGTAKALLIAPNTEWGKNVSKTLISRWQSLGGSIIDTYYYNPQANFAEDIPRLLHINTKADQEQMKTDNTKQVLEQQRRRDFDVIFLLAPPNTGRVIVPLLRYYYVENTPIYSTSIIYSGVRSPQKDNDLNGVIFCDIPALIKNTERTHGNRLYFVGRDAYLLSQEINRLTLLPNFPIYGSTGALSLTPERQIYRRLAWAKFQNGQP